jgi:hypothetical protein
VSLLDGSVDRLTFFSCVFLFPLSVCSVLFELMCSQADVVQRIRVSAIVGQAESPR